MDRMAGNAVDEGDVATFERGESAPIESSERVLRSLGRGLAISLIVILVAMAMILGTVFLSAGSLDRYAHRQSTQQVQRLLDLELGKLADLSLEYGWWNEAVELVIYERDTAWAEENVSGYLQTRYHIEWVLSLDREGRLVHGVHGEEELDALPQGLLTGGLGRLLDAARDTDLSDPRPASDLLEIDGVPALVAVAPYVVYEPTPYALDRAHGSLILIRHLDEGLLASWGDDFQVQGLRFLPPTAGIAPEADGRAALPIMTSPGRHLGTLQWQPEQPGQTFLNQFLPWVLGGTVLIGLGSLFFYHRLRAYGRMAFGNLMELSANRETLFRQANFDFLTGLSNRSLFMDHLKQELARCLRHDAQAAVLYIDLDGFKAVNDTLGHAVGDKLLCWVADAMSALVRDEDRVARFGGDEFCLLLPDVSSPNDAARVADKVHELLAKPIEVDGRDMLIGASIGIVMVPRDTHDLSTVFRYADIAMYQAKSSGNNQTRFYDLRMEERAQFHARLKGLFANSLKDDELYLRYQPIYSLDSHEVTGIEALLRWNSQALGEVSPAEFIPIAEESGMIDAIGLWVFERALTDLKRIQRETGRSITVSINVSARQLRDPGFPDQLDRLRERQGVERQSIRLEITESLLIAESDSEHSVLLELAERGYQLVLDDFGTGYSALGYLQRYPLESIKIDKSFVSGPKGALTNSALVETIVFMASQCGMKTVAEGIETPEQEAFLRNAGCTSGQGFLFSRPVSVEGVIALAASTP